MTKYQQPPYTYIGEVSLKVQDLDRSIAYYQTIIGLKVMEKSASQAKLTADGRKILVTLEQSQDIEPRPARAAGLYHFALLLPNRSALAVIVKFYLEHNVPFGASDHLVSEAIYLNDPDGNGIEIYADRSDDKWELNGAEIVMATEPLDGDSLLKEAASGKWAGLPQDTVMGHIHLYMRNIEKAKHFYHTLLGFDIVVGSYPGALFVSTGGYHHHIGLNTWNGASAPLPQENQAGMKWYSMVFPTAEARDNAIERLQNGGEQVQRKEENWYVSDPVGNIIILTIHQ